MIKKYYMFTIVTLLFFTTQSIVLGGTNMLAKLKEIDKSGDWKIIWCDGYEIYLCNLPFSESGKKLFEVQNRKFMLIGHRELSPDMKKIAFTLETYKGIYYSDRISIDLYLMNSNGTNLTKLPTESFKNLFLMGFLGNNKLLFEHSEVENYLHKPETRIIYSLDIDTNKIEKFPNQKISLNDPNASSNGDLLIYPENRETIIIYDVKNNTTEKINIKMDIPVLSPDGKKILFRRDDRMGSYYTVNLNGTSEELILSEKKIKDLLRGSGDYRDLQFTSWSPDSKFILLSESSDLQKGKLFVLDLETKEIAAIR